MLIEECLQIKRLIIEKYETVTSTNDVLIEKAKAGAPPGTVIISEHQTAGRGKMRKAFYSPAKTGVYMSILLKAPQEAISDLHITAHAAVAVAKAIEKHINEQVQIKWMNDIYYREKKVCGILAESLFKQDDKNQACIIVGIGINLTEPESGFPPELKDIAGALFDAGYNGVNLLIADIIKEFFQYNPALFNEYVMRSMLINKKISAYQNGKFVCSAYVDGINQQFELCLTLSDGTKKSLNSADISILLDSIN
ncbi:MAG: biotin--[Clostridia bacterium]|nr:biotin--[acetyl-CoA-carboxylase] ligase [Clostridia bacterium]